MKYRYQSGETVYEVDVERRGESYRVTINGEAYDYVVLDAQPGALTLHNGGDSPLRAQTLYWGSDGDVKWLSAAGCTYRLQRPRERRRGGAAGAAEADTLRAPMPAQVRAVEVAEGDTVEAGQTLLLLEAMKMEIKVASPRAGRVARVLAKTGQTVERDQVLVELA